MEKCPGYLSKTVMSSQWNMHFHTLSPVLRAPCARVSSRVCVCVFLVGGEMNTDFCLLHAASPSGRPQLYHWDVAP